MSVSVGRGTDTLFWFDRWLDDRPLQAHLPALFAISEQQSISVALALAGAGWNLSFRRMFGPLETNEWMRLSSAMVAVSLSNEPDVSTWWLEPSGVFSTKSLYGRRRLGAARRSTLNFGR